VAVYHEVGRGLGVNTLHIVGRQRTDTGWVKSVALPRPRPCRRILEVSQGKNLARRIEPLILR